MRSIFSVAALFGCAGLPALALAQDAGEGAATPGAPAGSESAPPEGEIVVTAPTGQGEAGEGYGAPDIRLGPDAIDSYGSNSVGDLLGKLSPQTGDTPIILLNGRRLLDSSGIAGLPPEALARVDILASQDAREQGATADQRVVNIVLLPRFRSVTINAEGSAPTAGGRTGADTRLNYTHIAGSNRLTIDLAYRRETMLTEAERGLETPGAEVRTLIPSAETADLSASLTRPVGGMGVTLIGQFSHSRGLGLFGLSADPGASEALTGRTRGASAKLGAMIDGKLGGWMWSLAAGYDHGSNGSRTERDTPLGVESDDVRSRRSNLSGTFFVVGSPVALPAGKATASIKGNLQRSAQQNRSRREADFLWEESRATQNQLSLDIALPISSPEARILPIPGRLHANLNAAHDGLSGIGGAESISYGLNWAPIEALQLALAFQNMAGLPPQLQRDAPVIVTPNVPVYDFVTGTTVSVSRIDGGNPDLRADRRDALTLSGTLRPPGSRNLMVRFGYSKIRTRDTIGALPAATAAVEAAFPERFRRDAAGRLLEIDVRPVNFARRSTQRLTWGFFWQVPLARAALAEGGEAVPAANIASPKALVLSFDHGWRLQNDVLIRPGLPVIDVLRGDGFGGRGQPRHQLNGQLNLTGAGLGLVVDASFESGSRLRGSSTTLRFSDLAKVNLRLFVNLDQQAGLVAAHPLFKGARLSLDVDNLLDARARVRDESGMTPLGYSAPYLDALGRNLSFSLRKLF